MPSMTMSPSWNGSSALTHLISVDLPEPDGPHTTTTSPLATEVVQSFSAWKLGGVPFVDVADFDHAAPASAATAMRDCNCRTPNEAMQQMTK